MFISDIKSDESYDFSEPKFRVSFEFLKRKDLSSLPVGWIELGEGVRAGVQEYDTFSWDENLFEAHNKFIDIQYIAEGIEYCGTAFRGGLEVEKPYDDANDCVLFKDPAEWSMVLLKAGEYAIFGPEDAHKPRCMAGEKSWVKKIVIKVPV